MTTHPPRRQTVRIDLGETQVCAFCGKPDVVIEWIDVPASTVPFPYEEVHHDPG